MSVLALNFLLICCTSYAFPFLSLLIISLTIYISPCLPRTRVILLFCNNNTIVTILFYFIFWHSSQLGLQIFYIGSSSAIKLMCNVFLRMVFQPFLCRRHVWWHVFQPYRLRWHVCWHKKRKALNWKEQHILMKCPELRERERERVQFNLSGLNIYE